MTRLQVEQRQNRLRTDVVQTDAGLPELKAAGRLRGRWLGADSTPGGRSEPGGTRM